MPELARFDGIVITMNFGDHAPPHFHVRAGSMTASVRISPFVMEEGALPAAAWRSKHGPPRVNQSFSGIGTARGARVRD
jgi:hypothetical protein